VTESQAMPSIAALQTGQSGVTCGGAAVAHTCESDIAFELTQSEDEDGNAGTSDIPQSDTGTADSQLRSYQRSYQPSSGVDKENLREKLERELLALKMLYLHLPTMEYREQPLHRKLNSYHDRILSTVDNFVTEKLPDEVAAVRNDLSKTGTERQYNWKPEDKT